MDVKLTAQDLVKFEEDVCELFKAKKIRSPIHIDDGNENQLIEIFKNYATETSWVCATWRSHFKCLLKGVPPEKLKQAICDNHSIGLCFAEHRVISSAIVGGIIPIALGLAMGIKRNNNDNNVLCFIGDMGSETGAAHEAIKYSAAHNLPVWWVVEDNNVSVCTDTRKTWNMERLTYEPENYQGGVVKVRENVLYFKYKSRFPHSGTGGARIVF